MAKFILKASKPLVVWHVDSLKTFSPGQVIEAAEAPHEWFELVEPVKKPKPVPKVKKAPVKEAPKPVLKKKTTAPKLDLPTEKF